jgi:hypothetical protein
MHLLEAVTHDTGGRGSNLLSSWSSTPRDGLQSASYGTASELRFNLTIGETQRLNSAGSLLGI